MTTFRWSLAAGVALLGCSSVTGPSEPQGSVFLPATVTVTMAWTDLQAPGRRIHLELRNTGPTAATAHFGVCAFLIQGHELQARRGPPEWSYLLPEIGGCGPDLLYVVEVPPTSGVDYVIGTIPARLNARGPALTLVFQVTGETGLRTLMVDQFVPD